MFVAWIIFIAEQDDFFFLKIVVHKQMACVANNLESHRAIF